MTLAEIVFTQKKLRKRYGVEGSVAGRYVEAGYSVAVGVETPAGRASFVAKKAGEILVADVINGTVKVTAEHVRSIAAKAQALRGRPVLILYGSGPILTEEAAKAAKEAGVVVKRVRP